MNKKFLNSYPQCPNCLKKTGIEKKIDGDFKVYFCLNCKNGFTHPSPKNINKYYPQYYWKNASALDKFKKNVFNILQERRVSWIKKISNSGSILDIGAGEGKYLSSLPKRYKLTSQEPKNSKVKNTKILKKDFLKWNTKEKFNIVCFWESLEHTPSPQRYLEKAHDLLKNEGIIIIEYPKYNCFEANLFGKYWFHLDLPRHLAHLTDKGMYTLLKRSGFTKIRNHQVLSLDYTPWGLMASILNILNFDITDYFKKSGNVFLFLFTIPIVGMCSVFELGFWLFDQSPIAIATAVKKD